MSRRGLKKVGDLNDGEYNPDSQGFATDPRGWGVSSAVTWGHKWKRLIWAPWYNKHGMGKNPSVYMTIATFILTFVGAMFYGWTFLAVYNTALNYMPAAAPNSLTVAIVLGLVAAAWEYMIVNWSRDNDIKIYSSVGTLFGSLFTFKNVGIFSFLLFGAANIGGFAAAGGILKALGIIGGEAPNPIVPLTNVAISSTSYWLSFAAATMIVFIWIYNDNLEQTAESENDNHGRFTLLHALAVFLFTTGFHGYGIISYNPGMYLAGGIASNDFVSTFGGDTVVVWAFWIFVPMLASSAAAGLLYLLFDGIGYLNTRVDEWDPRSNDQKEQETYGIQSENARIAGSYSGTTRLRQKRAVVVDF